MKELKVIQSTTEPKQTSVLWLSPEGLKRFTSNGWEVISGSSGGSGSGGNGGEIELPDVVYFNVERGQHGQPLNVDKNELLYAYKIMMIEIFQRQPLEGISIEDILNMSNEEFEEFLHQMGMTEASFSEFLMMFLHSLIAGESYNTKFIIRFSRLVNGTTFVGSYDFSLSSLKFTTKKVGSVTEAMIYGYLFDRGNSILAFSATDFTKLILCFSPDNVSSPHKCCLLNPDEYVSEELTKTVIDLYNKVCYDDLNASFLKISRTEGSPAVRDFSKLRTFFHFGTGKTYAFGGDWNLIEEE